MITIIATAEFISRLKRWFESWELRVWWRVLRWEIRMVSKQIANAIQYNTVPPGTVQYNQYFTTARYTEVGLVTYVAIDQVLIKRTNKVQYLMHYPKYELLQVALHDWIKYTYHLRITGKGNRTSASDSKNATLYVSKFQHLFRRRQPKGWNGWQKHSL